MTRRAVAAESGALLGGSIVNGLAALGFIALGTRSVGAAAFAPVANLWVFWAISAAVLTFPIQHWVIRQIEVDGHTGGVRRALPYLAGFTLAIAGVEAAVAAALRGDVFAGGSWVWPLMVFGVAFGAGYLGMLRGLLAGAGRYHAAALVIGGENVLRVAAAAVLMAAADDPALLGLALLAGPLIGLPFPGAHRLGSREPEQRPPTRLLGAAASAVLVAQVVLNGGPPLLAVLDGADLAVTALFSALALFRAPYLLALGLSVRATAPLTRSLATGGTGWVRRMSGLVVAASFALAAAAFFAARPLGPPLIRGFFGPDTAPASDVTGWLAAGCVLALGGLAVTVVLIAAARQLALTGSWLLALAVGAAVAAAAGSLDPLDRVVAAFVAAEGAAVLLGGGATLLWSRSA